MRVLLCFLGSLKADWYNELNAGPSARWGEWAEWSPCTEPCGVTGGTHTATRRCHNGQPGESGCLGPQSKTEKCSAACDGECASTFMNLADSTDAIELPIESSPAEICFWSTQNSPNASGQLVAYDVVSYQHQGNYFVLNIAGAIHTIPTSRTHAHTCIIFDTPNLVKLSQDGYVRNYPGAGVSFDSRVVTIGGGNSTFDGSVSEIAVSATSQETLVRKAQAAGSACNLNQIGAFGHGSLDGAWSVWGSCSHNCGGGRSYRYRIDDSNHVIQMYRSCNPEPCTSGWTDWSGWTPCDASCGGGNSYRTRSCVGPNICEGAPNGYQPCNGPPCTACGFSRWVFPQEQATTNYLMVKPVLSDMTAASICFSVENGLDQLHGTVFSYSRGLDSPRGNEFLFLGKDLTSDEIRLYKRETKISIPNDVLVPGEKAHFCITLQTMNQGTLMTSMYVNGFIAVSSSEGHARNGVVLPGGGEMIIGQDQDCILGCFNSSQAFVGNLQNFAIYDVALNPEEVFNLWTDDSCESIKRKPVLTLSKDSVMVYGKPVFQSEWGEFGEWSSCSVTCGAGVKTRKRPCRGGRPNDDGCPGSHIESAVCATGVECDPFFASPDSTWSEWGACNKLCGGGGERFRIDQSGNHETEECGNRACTDVSEWSNWSDCSETCGHGFTYRQRDCFNGPCDVDTQEVRWCDLGKCVDSWKMPWPCGEVPERGQKTMRIVGGYSAQPMEIPWICILELRSDPICGASVIAPKWNIGASHCVSQTFDRPEQMRMLCGVHDRTVVEEGLQTGQVVQYYKHPKYSGSTIDYDLCLFEMADPWHFTDYVKPVCLPGLHQFPAPGTLCKVGGWGSIHPVAPGHFLWHVEMAESLRAVHVPIIEQAQCAAKYKDQITRRMFCAGYTEGGRDACQGDSGGPIACQIGNDDPPRWQLTGVVSWGIGCAQKKSARCLHQVGDVDRLDL